MVTKAEAQAGRRRAAASSGAGPPVVVSRDGSVAIVTLANPSARNALSKAMLQALQTAVDSLSADAAVHVVVLAAEGPAFCAGHDLKELTRHRADADGGRAFYAEVMAACSRLMQSIVRSPKPFIAAVQGTATAAGCQLVATCDLAVASEAARFCTPGVDIGLFCSTPMVALSRNVPRKRALEMLLTGELIGAREAAAWGLVNGVVPADRLLPEALALAARIASKSPATVALGKAAFYRQIEAGLTKAYDDAACVMVENMMLRDAEEGIGAFIDKRQPKWRGC